MSKKRNEMRKIFAILAVVAIAACSKIDDAAQTETIVVKGYMSEQTRTEFGTPRENEIPYKWSVGDYMWLGTTKSTNTLTESCSLGIFNFSGGVIVPAHLFYNMTGQAKNDLAKKLMKEYEISAVAYTSQIETSFQNTLDSISIVVLILIVCAGLLAFIVLYNLSIINITERLREIATIKVLGFDDLEVSAYIFRENIILTILGIILGIGVGIVLHNFVMVTVETDVYMFGRELSPISIVIATVLTIIFTIIVNLIMRHSLKKIDMVESLKSVE